MLQFAKPDTWKQVLHIKNLENIKDNTLINNIKNGVYSDYHALRPMNEHYEVKWKIYDLL